MKALISAKWLYHNLSNPNLVILDASSASRVDGGAFNFIDDTIPDARRLDLKTTFSDTASPFPNTIPPPAEFEMACRELGINRDSIIIVFDNNGIYSSPRAWWLFKVMGHKNIAVLDGGLPHWVNMGFPTTKKHLEDFERGNFKVGYDENLVMDFKTVNYNIHNRSFVLVDARSAGRFNGTAAEPRQHIRSGHIPQSVNIPYTAVLHNGRYKGKKELYAIFNNACPGARDLVFSCGSGVTACIIMLACKIGYAHSLKLYDGSWTEWATLNNLKAL